MEFIGGKNMKNKKLIVTIILAILMMSLFNMNVYADNENSKLPNTTAKSEDYIVQKNMITGEMRYLKYVKPETRAQASPTALSGCYETQPYIPPSLVETPEISPFAVFGPDNRFQIKDTTRYPHSAIALMSV